ncbi:hypothetical protein LX32DRAFT_349067 [Colletotrichum zoysiae]|uniref:Uncharacterized protein n=1 Tax=Colletotrichum zoysiae TaxID=1216348 RepID=A0AAD9M0S8_9PEZI|nr:hypothetical protein LX32DRAFT_349067 [Colletotrichum zoysiae]
MADCDLTDSLPRAVRDALKTNTGVDVASVLTGWCLVPSPNRASWPVKTNWRACNCLFFLCSIHVSSCPPSLIESKDQNTIEMRTVYSLFLTKARHPPRLVIRGSFGLASSCSALEQGNSDSPARIEGQCIRRIHGGSGSLSYERKAHQSDAPVCCTMVGESTPKVTIPRQIPTCLLLCSQD